MKSAFSRAEDVICKTLVYYNDADHMLVIPIPPEISRTIVAWVGWDGMSYWMYVTLKCYDWKVMPLTAVATFSLLVNIA